MEFVLQVTSNLFNNWKEDYIYNERIVEQFKKKISYRLFTVITTSMHYINDEYKFSC